MTFVIVMAQSDMHDFSAGKLFVHFACVM